MELGFNSYTNPWMVDVKHHLSERLMNIPDLNHKTTNCTTLREPNGIKLIGKKYKLKDGFLKI